MILNRLKYLLLLLLISAFHSGWAQKQTVDSLNNVLRTVKEDTTRLRLYLELGESCEIKDNYKYGKAAFDIAHKLLAQEHDPAKKTELLKKKAEAGEYICVYFSEKKQYQKMFDYKDQCLMIYQETNDTVKISNALSDYFYFYGREGNIPKALKYCEQGLSIFQKMNYKKGIADFLEKKGLLYSNAGMNEQELLTYDKCLFLYSELKDTANLANIYELKGITYGKKGDIKQALINFEKSRLLFEKTGNTLGLRLVFNSIGNMYRNNNDLPNALNYYQRSLLLSQRETDANGTIQLLCGIGDIYTLQGDLKSAFEYNNKALGLAKTHFNKYNLLYAYQSLARSYLKQKDYSKAKQCSDEALTLAKMLRGVQIICKSERLCATADSAAGAFKTAYLHYHEYSILEKRLKDDEVKKAAARDKYQSEYEKQKALDEAAELKKDQLAKEEAQHQKMVRNAFIGGFLLLLIVAGFIYRSYREKQKSNKELAEKNKEIEEKNKDIMDSIRYAKRIQTSLLPTEKYIDKNIKRLKKD